MSKDIIEVLKQVNPLTLRMEIYKYIYNLENQLALTEKALELSCEEINMFEDMFNCAYVRGVAYLADDFKTKAKEIINESNND